MLASKIFSKRKKRSATVGPTSSKNRKQKQKKEVKAPADAAEPSNDAPTPTPPPATCLKTVTIGRRCIYATCTIRIPRPNLAKLEPRIRITIVKELHKCGCSAPTNPQIQINVTTGTISLTTLPAAESIEYTCYPASMTIVLNAELLEGLQDYMEFRRASLLIHIL